MAGEFTNINSDSSGNAGYVVTPQEILKRDARLLKALEAAPQDDPIVRQEERTIAHEMSQALHDLTTPSHTPMSGEEVIDALARSLSNGNHNGYGSYGNQGGYGNNSGYGNQSGLDPFDAMLAAGSGNYGGGLDSTFGHGAGSGIFGDQGYDNNLGQIFGDHGSDAEAINRFDALAARAQYARNDRHEIGIAGGNFNLNSDSTVEGNVNGHDLAGSSILKTGHENLIDVSKNDMPSGFQLSNTVGDWTGAGNQYTQSVNGMVNGHKVETWTDGDGDIKAQVDGKVVDRNNPDPTGTVSFQQGGPGNCGIVSINGKDDKTGAQIKVDITKDITHDGLHYHHHGLNVNVSQMRGADGRPLHVGGAVAQEIKNPVT